MIVSLTAKKIELFAVHHKIYEKLKKNRGLNFVAAKNLFNSVV